MSLSKKKAPLEIEPDLTRQQAAALLNVGLAKLDELIRDRVIDSYKLGNDRRAGRRIVRQSVERLRSGSAA